MKNLLRKLIKKMLKKNLMIKNKLNFKNINELIYKI